MRSTGTHVRGIRTPIIKQGDNLIKIIVESLEKAQTEDNFQLERTDVLSITESLVARARGNYVKLDDVAHEIKAKFPGPLGVVFPILSRNRFSLILKGIARAGKKIYLQLNYPDDEVGNPILPSEKLLDLEINPHSDSFSEEEYRQHFSDYRHPFTGINYVDLYREMAGDCELEIVFSNDPCTILNYTEDVLVADIHTRHKTKRRLKTAGARTVFGLDDLCTEKKAEVQGYNPEYGLLGSNKAGPETLKLFPRDCDKFVVDLQKAIEQRSGTKIQVMVFADGAFKDPVGGIWELADPTVSPGYSAGLEGTPNEIKIKYLADHQYADLKGDKLMDEIRGKIGKKQHDLVGSEEAQGTTPRQLTDLLGSLSDLVSGSGDKGTPIVHIKGYFDSLAED